jgi:hypothetical protein
MPRRIDMRVDAAPTDAAELSAPCNAVEGWRRCGNLSRWNGEGVPRNRALNFAAALCCLARPARTQSEEASP